MLVFLREGRITKRVIYLISRHILHLMSHVGKND